MKRLHVHVSVDDVEKSAEFYSTVFGAKPTVEKDDYAKWLLDDPAVNFAISKGSSGSGFGLSHLGVQSDDPDGFKEITQRLKAADQLTFDQTKTTCCYAVSDKTWVEDPSGLRWETFYTHGEATTYGSDDAPAGSALLQS